MENGMDLLMLAVDPDRDGRPRFTPALAPALVLADLLDKIRRGRSVPDSMAEYLRARAPGRLDRYVDDACRLGILEVSVRRQGYFEHTRIRIADRWPLDRAVDRLVRILSTAQHPGDRDLAFVVLAEEIGRAQVLLKGRKHRERRQHLATFVSWAADRDRHQSVADAVLHDGLRAIRLITAAQQATSLAVHR